MESKLERIKAIDGLRGICAIIVVLNHFIVGFFPAAYFGEGTNHIKGNIEQVMAQSPFSFWYSGNFMVCVFCIITAYIVTVLYYKNEVSIIKTATNRYFRLVIPAFIISLIAFLFMSNKLFSNIDTAVITGSGWLNSLYNFEPDILDLLRGSFYDVVFTWYDKYNTVFWMLPLLFKGTLLTVFIIRIWGNIRKRFFIYCIFVILLFAQGHIYELAFIYGIICADLKHNFKLQKHLNEYYYIVLIIAGIFLGGYPTGMIPTNYLYSWLNIGNSSFMVWHTLGGFLLFFGVINSHIMNRLLSNKPILWLGKISFSIFLIHIIIICSFSSSLFNVLYEYSNNYLVSFAGMFIPSMLFIILASYLFNLTIERYTDLLVKRITLFILKD